MIVEVQYGRTEPRIWTKPLRELTPETSLGFEVIAFAAEILGVHLYPWQRWLLIHALELLPNGDYRFQRVIVLVARQNGKTLLGSVLTAWWLFRDSKRHPDRVPPIRFKVVGVAQNLDIAREPWAGVKTWCDPKPETEEEADLALPLLQRATAKVIDTNGKEAIYARSRAHYEIRAAANARGKPAARVLMDEMREQKTWAAWNAVSQTLKSFGGLGQLWGISNAGDVGAIVLRAQRDKAIAAAKRWDDYVEAGLMEAEEFANGNDVSLAIFEWSAPDGCALDDVDAILQANPSIGYGEITVRSILADMPPAMTDAGYRTEALCQWVTSRVKPHIDSAAWLKLLDEDSVIDTDSQIGLAVDVSADRQWTYLAVAGYRADGLIHVEVIAARAGMVWLPSAAKELQERWGLTHVALQARGTPAGEFVPALQEAGFEIQEIAGASDLGAVPGGLRDRVSAGQIRHLGQPLLTLALSGAVVKRLGAVDVFDRAKSPIDWAPAVAVAEAVWALEHMPEPSEPPPPPSAGVLAATEPNGLGSDASLVNLATASF